MYKIGDKVVYPMHGAGEIVEVVEKEILGSKKDYFVLKMPIGDMKVLLPVETVDAIGIRQTISSEEIDQLLNSIDDMECIENINWNKRYRENMDRLRTGCVEDVANVIKALLLRDQGKSLSTGERKMLSTAKQILTSEIMLVKKITMDEADQLINKHVI
ncbi:MAG: CarD family transcriptional regulator [Clostridia bacterium]|nr:CarD family transcriptional regulator [Clostridia bacterium]